MSGIQERALAVWFLKPNLDSLNSILDASQDDLTINYFVFNIVSNLLKEQQSLNGFLSFNYFYNISGAEEEQLDQFIEAVYVLVRYPFSILVQKFRVFDEARGQWMPIENQMVEDAYKGNEFFHPLIGTEISKETFNKIVTPYFELSEKGKTIFVSSKII